MADLPVNSYNLRISKGKAEIGKPMVIGQYDVEVRVRGDIVKVETSDNQNGSVDVTYVLKATELNLQ